MKYLILSSAFLYTVVAGAAPEAGRSLPRGENNPLYVERIFVAEQGQMEFLRAANGETRTWLRQSSGALLPFRELNGSKECEAWYAAENKALPGPYGCELIFSSAANPDEIIRVPTNEIQEASLFDLASPKRKRGANVSL